MEQWKWKLAMVVVVCWYAGVNSKFTGQQPPLLSATRVIKESSRDGGAVGPGKARWKTKIWSWRTLSRLKCDLHPICLRMEELDAC